MKKYYLLAIIGILVFVLIPALAFSAGPANKVTGNVTRLRQSDLKESTFIFNAHEPKDGRPAKGLVTIEGLNYNVYLEIQIDFVKVDSATTAYFGGKTIASNVSNPAVGHYAMFYVEDIGEPGIGEDVVLSTTTANKTAYDNWTVNPSSSGMNLYNVIEGNLQVHYYGE